MQVDGATETINKGASISGSGSSATVWTVPTGEVWKVTISLWANSFLVSVDINNTGPIAGALDGSSGLQSASFTTVVTGGDVIEAQEFKGDDVNGAVHVSGRRVDTDVDNTAISEQLTVGDSVTVPSGETWEVFVSNGSQAFNTHVTVNGNRVNRVQDKNDPMTHGLQLSVSDGDTISLTETGNDTGEGAAHIGGFKI